MKTEPSEDAIRQECERLWAAHRSRWGQVQHYVERTFVRAGRIACAAAIAFYVYRRRGPLTELVDKPLGQLTLGDLGLVVLCLFGAIIVVVVCWAIAFGSYQPPSNATAFRGQALINVKRQEEWARDPLLRWLRGFKERWKSSP